MKYFFTLFILISFHLSFGQKYYPSTQEEFGKNRMQTKRFEWKTVKSSNYEFNYYRGGDTYAKLAAKTAEKEFDKITEVLGYTPFTTMKIFIYNTPKDFEQSNIGLTSPIEFDGGILNLSKSRIQIPYAGNDSLFKINLVEQISNLFVYDMLYGGSLKEVLQSSLLLTIPEWYISGVSAYIANRNNPDNNQIFKDAIIKMDNTKLSHLKDEDARIIGQSIWNYIALKYGKDNISNILNLTRIIRTEQSSITSTLGISFSKFIAEWKQFYLVQNGKIETNKIDKGELKTESTNVNRDNPLRLNDLKPNEIDVNFYEFEPENIERFKLKQAKEKLSENQIILGKSINNSEKEFKLSTPKAFQNLLTSNNLNFGVYNDPVRKFGLGGDITLNDLLENNVIKFAGYVNPFSLKNHDFTAEYSNFKGKNDWKVKFERRSTNLEFGNTDDRFLYLFKPYKLSSINNSTSVIFRRLLYHKLSASYIHPINKNLKVQFSPGLISNNDYDTFDFNKKNILSTYISGQIEGVYDNTVQISPSILSGTRAKLSLEKYTQFGNKLGNFNVINLDARHYQKLVPGLIFASRINFVKSTGNAPIYGFIGGVDNWINRKLQPINGQTGSIPVDLRALNFYNFPGSMRGFPFAKLYGNNTLLTNFELRFSLSSFIPQNSVTSNFIRNLQFVLFDDIGSAWNGNKGPFNRQNSLNTEFIGGPLSNFNAVVINFKNPFIMGYGIGLRSTILGLKVKADYGFGYENKAVNPAILSLSFGQDF